MKIVIASDSFKGCLSSAEVADSARKGVSRALPSCEIVCLAVADGGEGTVDAVFRARGGEVVKMRVHGPAGRPVDASYLIMPDRMTAVVEIAAASGLPLLDVSERNPMEASTYGTGELIADALGRGCRRFIIGLGGSATNDAGMGLMCALGYRFMDKDSEPLPPKGSTMSAVCRIDDSAVPGSLRDSAFILACDVDSPFCGPEGAAYVFAPQKGAGSTEVKILDEGMHRVADAIFRKTGTDIRDMAYAGAAGGTAGTMMSLLGAEVRSGALTVLEMMGFEDIISDADLLLTGEGRIDAQTMSGKLPYVAASVAESYGVPAVALCGDSILETGQSVFRSIIKATPADMPLYEAMKPETASANIADAVYGYLSSRES